MALRTGTPTQRSLPLDLNAAAGDWPLDRADAVIAINMVHISPATVGRVRHAARLLGSGGPLLLHGPFRRKGETLAPGNASFDADLRTRNRALGLRRLEDVVQEAEGAGFVPDRVVSMPADNLSLVPTKARAVFTQLHRSARLACGRKPTFV